MPDFELKAIVAIASCKTLDQLLIAERRAEMACGKLTGRVEGALRRRYSSICQLLRIRFVVGG